MKIYTVVTTLGTSLVCFEDGTLGHAAWGAPAKDHIVPVVAACPDARAELCIMEAPGAAHGFRIGDDVQAAQVLLLQQFGVAAGLFFLRNLDDGRYLQLGAIDETGLGIASYQEIAVTQAPAFHLVPLAAVPAPGVLTKLHDDFAFDADWLAHVLELRDKSLWPLVRGFLKTLGVTEVRAAWSSVRRSSVHDELFPLIAAFCRGVFPAFPAYTAEALKDFAQQFGWSIGEQTYGKPLIFEPSLGKLTIGRYCSLADPRIILGNHIFSAPACYPFMTLWTQWPGTYVGLQDHNARDVVIGNDVWIGVGAIILPGAIIGDGAVIAAGAVVGGSIAPYSICAGVPATVKRKRFDDITIERLLALRWWNWSDAVVDRYIHLLLAPDPRDFLAVAEAEFGTAQELAATPRSLELAP